MRIMTSLLLLSLTACTATTQSGREDLSFDLRRQTAGPAVIVGFSALCGAPQAKLDRFTQSYMTFASQKQALTNDERVQMRAMLANAPKMVADGFKSAADKAAYCAEHPVDHKVLDRGIKGDFTGLL